jgi:predicted ATPase/DNA-binding winged helix-turn-helix (wHTH) protein
MAPSKDIIFPPFRLDLAGQQLHLGKTLVPLRPKTFAVLHYLLNHPRQLVTKSDLLDAVWPDTAISDTVLKVCIREIREALQDDAEVPRFIETVHRKGYRFIGNIRTNNLPAPLTRFVGRERETAELKRLLEADVRLLMLTGAGGCGKTRLAAQVVHDLTREHAVEVWWVDLAPLTEESLVPQAIMSALAIHEHSGKAPIQTLCDHLRPRTLTLVLDNCEHLIKTTATLVDALLQMCPELKIVATSRECFGIKGEIEFPVSPLSLPEDPQTQSPDQLLKSDAIRLFVDRAVVSSPRFAFTDHNARLVVELCQRLDGIPLAIELAAARLKVLTLEQTVARLDDCFLLLSGSKRTELPRHQTLRATIDWSYNLLSEQERALQRRLSVFAGKCTLEAVEETCAFDDIDRRGVLDLISHLIDKSLVLMTEDKGAARYRVLETIRQYGLRKLEETNETDAVRGRHIAFYLHLAETIAPRINTAVSQCSGLSMTICVRHCDMRRRVEKPRSSFGCVMHFSSSGSTEVTGVKVGRGSPMYLIGQTIWAPQICAGEQCRQTVGSQFLWETIGRHAHGWKKACRSCARLETYVSWPVLLSFSLMKFWQMITLALTRSSRRASIFFVKQATSLRLPCRSTTRGRLRSSGRIMLRHTSVMQRPWSWDVSWETT